MSGQRTVGTPVPLPGWWLVEMRTAFDNASWTYQKLADALTQLLGRKPKYDHKAVSRFMAGEITTLEMLQGVLRLLPSLPQPVFIAHSRDEAEQLSNVVRRIRSTPEWNARYGSLDEITLLKAQTVRDQTETLPSGDEAKARHRSKDGRGVRRVG